MTDFAGGRRDGLERDKRVAGIRHIFIINPAAGKKESNAHLEGLLDQLSFPRERLYTTGEGDACRLARQAAESGEDVRIYACGGDGTLNEVVNGAAGFDNAAVTCVPKGTGNDFLKLFGPRFRELFNDLEALAAGPQRAFDLMDCNGKLGLDVVCAGVDARIAAGVHRYKDLRFVSGIGAYLLSLTEQVIFRGLCRPLTIRADGLDWQERQTAILCICNGRHYGGGFMPVPDAMPDDGVLDVLAVGEISRLTFFRLVGKYAQGLYRQYPQFITDWHGQSLSFSSPREITVVVDGEVMRGTRFTVRLSPLKINFFFPAGADYSPEF